MAFFPTIHPTVKKITANAIIIGLSFMAGGVLTLAVQGNTATYTASAQTAKLHGPSLALGGASIDSRQSGSRLGELIVLDSLVNGRANDDGSEDEGGISRLGELIILNGLFGDRADIAGDRNISRLGELIVLDSLVNGRANDDGSEDEGGISRLGELIILNGLFGNQHSAFGFGN